MSGSESSVRPEPPEALSFTVHGLPSPDAPLDRRRVVSGRWRMLLVLLACAAPVVASYLTYYVIRPEGRTNYGTLITPTRSLPDGLVLHDLAGHRVAPASLRGQWLLLIVGGGACDPVCEQHVYFQRQLREMLGRERERVDRVWLITDDATPSAALQTAANATGPLTLLRTQREAVARWLEPQAGHRLEDHVYLVDPLGEWMMRLPAEPDPARAKRDLDRLLRAAASWDQPGR
jgi:hypothetical protein